MDRLKEIAEILAKPDTDMQLYIVGGAVRDELMGRPIEDVDICIVGGRTALNVGSCLEILKKTGKIDGFTTVHGSFPIWIVEIDGVKYEFAMARKERKSGQSRTEFECEVRNVTIEEDLGRRDLTINAVAKNLLTGKYVDPYDGIEDINTGIAHPVTEAFKEDSLRVYRAARFVARFELYPSPKLLQYCRELRPDDISNERVGMELMKNMKQAKVPSHFFYFLREVGWLGYHFKEIEHLIDVPQSPKHHPEGDVFTHTMYCLDAAQGWFLRTVMLCHDLGKAIKTTVNDELWHQSGDLQRWYNQDEDKSKYKVASVGHEEAGVELTRNMLQRIHFTDHRTIRNIACLVKWHMLRAFINKDNYDKMIRRCLRELIHYRLSYYDLVDVIECDLKGRPPLVAPSRKELDEQMYTSHAMHILGTGQMVPIVTGEVLLAHGIPEGPEMGDMIKKALEFQDRGTLKMHNWKQVLHGAGFKSLKL